MIRAGDAITNAVTGERLLFHRTASDTDGEYVLVEPTVQPGGFVAAAHVHPNQDERFEVLEGTLCLRLRRQMLTAHAGETVTVPAGTVTVSGIRETARPASCARCVPPMRSARS
jgi:quercetin dioxygenase-like cupin family protein